jgi:hypothetical protein
MRLVVVASCFMSVLMAPPALAAGEPEARTVNGRLAVAWSQVAYDIAFAEDQFRTFKGQCAIAMMHIAMHDALNTIKRKRSSHPTSTGCQARFAA